MKDSLEEAAENFWLNDDSMTDNDRISYVNGFGQGAKWQQERSYREEEVNFIISEALESALVNKNLELWFNIFKKK